MNSGAQDDHAEVGVGSQEWRGHEGPDPRAEDALRGGEAGVGLGVQDEGRLALLRHLPLEAPRVEEIPRRAGKPAGGGLLQVAEGVLEEDDALLRAQVREGPVEDQLHQLFEGDRLRQGPVDLVQNLHPVAGLAFCGGRELRGRPQKNAVRGGDLVPGALRLLGGGGGEALDGDHRLRELDEVSACEVHGRGHRAAVQERRVPRSQVLHVPGLPLEEEPGVEPREEAVGEDEVRLRRAADHERFAVAEVLERVADGGRDAKTERRRSHLGVNKSEIVARPGAGGTLPAGARDPGEDVGPRAELRIECARLQET